MTKAETETIEYCLRNLNALEGCRAEFIPAKRADGDAGELRLSGPWGNRNFRVVTCLRLSAASAEVVIYQLQSQPGEQPIVLFSDFVGNSVAVRLRQSGIGYVDAAGNTYLIRSPLYLDISGRKRQQRPPRADRLFQPASLKLLYLLLRLPQAIRWTYRDLAKGAGIALGAVGTILQELNRFELLDRDPPSGAQLLAMNDLLIRWQTGYSERLRPKLYLNRCRLEDGSSLTELCQQIGRVRFGNEVLIGGELGARLLTQSHPAGAATLHLAGDPLRTMLQLQLVPDSNGPVTLLNQFGNANHWQGWQPDELCLADPLLLHAELLTGVNTNGTLADKLYKRYLEPRLAGEPPD